MQVRELFTWTSCSGIGCRITSSSSFFIELLVAGSLTAFIMRVASQRSVVRGAGTGSSSRLRFENECVDLFADALLVFGIPKSVGQIYGLLFASPTPLCFSDVVERLQISKGSASQGIQLLRSLGAISSVRNSASAESLGLRSASDCRREYFKPELSLRRLVSGVLVERVAPLAKTGSARVIRLRALSNEASRDHEFFAGRVKQLETWRRRLRSVLPILKVVLGPKN